MSVPFLFLTELCRPTLEECGDYFLIDNFKKVILCTGVQQDKLQPLKITSNSLIKCLLIKKINWPWVKVVHMFCKLHNKIIMLITYGVFMLKAMKQSLTQSLLDTNKMESSTCWTETEE